MDKTSRWFGVALVSCALSLIGCGGGSGEAEKPAPPARSAREIAPGGGRITAGTKTMDVQIGHPLSQRPVASGNVTLEGGAAVKP